MKLDLDAIQVRLDDESERIPWAQDEEDTLALITRVRELEKALDLICSSVEIHTIDKELDVCIPCKRNAARAREETK